MRKSWGYIIALLAGVSLGWLAQQFWYAGAKQNRISADEHSFLRNEQRLKDLIQSVSSGHFPMLLSKAAPLDSSKLILEFIKAGRIDMAAQLITDDGERYAQDLSISKLVATKFLANNSYHDAMIFLYEQRLFVEQEIENDLLLLIYRMVEDIDSKLGELSQYALLIDFYRLLVGLHADHSPYYLRLTHWLIKSGDIYMAEQSLAGALHDIQYQESIFELEERIARYEASKNQVVIPLTKVGEHFVLELSGTGFSGLKLMLDTGASMTVIKESIAESQFPEILEHAQSLLLNTANGVVSGLKVTLPVIQMQNVQMQDVNIEEVAIGIMPLPDFQYDGLLGMNILNRFEFFLDQEMQQLVLK